MMLLTGRFREVASNTTTFIQMLQVVITVILIDAICTLIIWMGFIKGSEDKKNRKHMKVDYHFLKHIMLVFAEEVFARWFFLGLLTKISVLSGTTAFHILFLIGNGSWALIHLPNWEKGDNRITKVLSIFLAGFFFSYVYIKCGLLPVILLHFGRNTVLWALDKVQEIDPWYFVHIGYTALCGIVSYVLMKKPLSDILPWFDDNPVYHLQGWEFWDYVNVSIYISSCVVVVCGLLLYDRGEVEKDRNGMAWWWSTLFHACAIMVMLMVFPSENGPYHVLTLSILIASLQKGASMSAVSRTFWCGVPIAYILICVFNALEFWQVLGWAVMLIIVYAPVYILNEVESQSHV